MHEVKLTRMAVNYRRSDQPGVLDCHVCAHRVGSQCEIMEGTVSRGMVCDYFRSGEMTDDGHWEPESWHKSAEQLIAEARAKNNEAIQAACANGGRWSNPEHYPSRMRDI